MNHSLPILTAGTWYARMIPPMRTRTFALLVLLLLVAGELRWGWVTVIPAEPYVWHVDAPIDTGAHPPANWQQWVTTFWDRGPLPLPQ